MDNFFQVPPEALAVDSQVLFYYRDKNTIILPRKCRVVLDWPRVPHPRLIFDGIEDFVDGEPQWTEVLFHLEGLGWIQR